MTGIENAQFDLMAYVQQKYQKAVWGAVEHILRNHIDNPIVGELTKEKIKAAGIRSVFFSEEPPNLEFEKCDEKEVSCKLTSNLIGVAQGHWMICYNGARRPLTDKEEAYLTAQEQLNPDVTDLTLENAGELATKAGVKVRVRCETEAKFTELLDEEGYGIERKGIKEVAYVAKKGANTGDNNNTGNNNNPPTGELEG